VRGRVLVIMVASTLDENGGALSLSRLVLGTGPTFKMAYRQTKDPSRNRALRLVQKKGASSRVIFFLKRKRASVGIVIFPLHMMLCGTEHRSIATAGDQSFCALIGIPAPHIDALSVTQHLSLSPCPSHSTVVRMPPPLPVEQKVRDRPVPMSLP
jgi:hypothetical protein